MKVVLLLLALTFMEAVKETNSSLAKEQSHLVLHVTSIVYHHFVADQTLLISSIRSDNTMVDFLLKNINELALFCLQVFKAGTTAPVMSYVYYEPVRSYLILTGSVEELTGQAEELVSKARLNARAQFMVVVTTAEVSAQLLATSILQELWGIVRAIDAVVLVQNDAVFQLYTWFPYQSDKHCVGVEDVVLVDQWSLEAEGRIINDGTLFPNKIPINAHGCPIKVSFPFNDRNDVRYVTDYLRSLNFTVMGHYKHLLHGNGSDYIQPSAQDLASGQTEIVVGIPLQMGVNEIGDNSFPYSEEIWAWYVPCARPVSRILRLFHIFSSVTILAVLLTILLTAVMIWCLARHSLESQSYTNFSRVIQNVWAAGLGASVSKMPKAFRLRAVLFGWVCSSLALGTIYQAFFTSYLTDPGFEKQIMCVEELISSKMQYGIMTGADFMYSASGTGGNQELMLGGENCSVLEICIQRIIDTGNFAVFSHSDRVRNYLDSVNDTTSVCLMNNFNSFAIQIVTYFSKGSCLLPPFNNYITTILESGIFVKDEADNKLHSVDRNIANEDILRQYSVFSLSYLSVVFYTILVGHSLGFVVLVGELIHCKFAKHHCQSVTAAFNEH